MPHENTYRQMAEKLREIGVETSFPDLHHFSNPKFAKGPLNLARFCEYCEGVSKFKSDGENRQTIQRAMAFAEKVQQGISRDTAIAAVWQNFPLVTR